MTGKRGDAHRIVRWVWTSRSAGARFGRALLMPGSAIWGSAVALKRWSYRRGWQPSHPMPAPTIAIGNLSVGGSGKTPIAAWVASYLASRGVRPGVLLRGVGGDEVEVHRELVPSAVVVANPDRVAGAAQAVLDGAQALVLDDAYQRLDIDRDLNVCLISAESAHAVRWLLPAGPWREPWHALERADFVVITRKRADATTASSLAAQVSSQFGIGVAVARLDLSMLRGLVSGREEPVDSLHGRRVVAASAIADPEAFVAQVKRTGAQVQVATWKDHHQFRDEDVAWLAHAARKTDSVVITAKDAVKLRNRWPASVPEPMVAMLTVTFEAGQSEFEAALDRCIGSIRGPLTSQPDHGER